MFVCHTCHLDSQPTFRKALSRWHFAYNIMILFKFMVEACLKTKIIFNRQSSSLPLPQKPLGCLTMWQEDVRQWQLWLRQMWQVRKLEGRWGSGKWPQESYPVHTWPAPQPGWTLPRGVLGSPFTNSEEVPALEALQGLPSSSSSPCALPSALSMGCLLLSSYTGRGGGELWSHTLF